VQLKTRTRAALFWSNCEHRAGHREKQKDSQFSVMIAELDIAPRTKSLDHVAVLLVLTGSLHQPNLF
jgi:hypothetical protein